MAYKTGQQEFVTSWNKTVDWARQKGIPQGSWYPVYQMDSQRLQSGQYTMSESERVRAILSATTLQASTPLPTDKPSPTAVWHNTTTDLQNIFTGLMPTRIASNIYDTLKDAFLHPENLFNVNDPNSIAQWIPGVSVVNELEHGGLATVAEHPISSFLDVLPLADAAGTVIGKSAIGDAAARAVGLQTGDQFAHTSPIRLVGKAIGQIPTGYRATDPLGNEIIRGSKGLVRDSEGKAVHQPLTFAQSLHKFAMAKGISGDIGKVAGGALSVSQRQSVKMAALFKGFAEKVNGLTDEQRVTALSLLTKSGKSTAQLAGDSSIDVAVRQAIDAYAPIENWFIEQGLQAGDYIPVQAPDGQTYLYSTRPGSGGPAIQNAKEAYDDALDAWNKATEKANQHADLMGQTRKRANLKSRYISNVSQRVYSALGRASRDSVPNLPTTVAHIAQNNGFDPDLVSALFKIHPADLTKYHFTHLAELFSPNGLIDSIQKALEKDDWEAVKKLSGRAQRLYKNQTFRSLFDEAQSVAARSGEAGGDAAEVLLNLGQIIHGLHEDSLQMSDHIKNFDAAYKGKYKTSKRGNRVDSVDYLAKQVKKTHEAWDQAVFRHPPAIFQPLYVDVYIDNLLKRDPQFVRKASSVLKDYGVSEDNLDELRSNPNSLYELVRIMSDSSENNPFRQFTDPGEIAQIRNSALEEIAKLRAQGFKPAYIPKIDIHDLGDPHQGSYNVFISSKRIPTVSASYERMMDTGSSVYNIMAQVEHGIRERLQRDGTIEFFDKYVTPMAYKKEDLLKIALHEFPVARNISDMSRQAYLENIIQNEWGLRSWNPESIFGISSARLGATDNLYIPKGLADALEKIVNRDQFPASTAISKGTKVFKTAILGFSPRYIAHILFGGSFLLALRSSPLALTLGNAARKALAEGSLPDDIFENSTQEGAPDIHYHYAGGRSMGWHLLKESLDSKFGPGAAATATLVQYLSVIPDLTFRFTRYVTNFQRAIAYLDGYESAARHGYAIDPDSGLRVPMTHERAMTEGMRHAIEVMGDLRSMTPLERSVAQSIMPFYGWTKHVLTYVGTYPMDHPYRAMFLSHLAEMNSQDVPSALPTRIQNLFFLGTPDKFGNVTAVDVRAINPLRDVANYATLAGFLSQLNPAIVAPFAAVDPQITFGSNVLYPNLSYNQLYGTTTSDAQGGALQAAEQFVPELTALDAAMGLSSQFRNLKRSGNNTAYAKAIYEALNIPWEPQQINLRQMAAKNELDRYKQSETAAQTFWQTGDTSQLAGYSTLPDPQQTLYNVTPDYLENIYNQQLQKTGLPPSVTLPNLPAPPGL